MPSPNRQHEAELAWQLNERINDLSRLLWEIYEKPFVERAMIEESMPDYLEMDSDDPDDDIPF